MSTAVLRTVLIYDTVNTVRTYVHTVKEEQEKKGKKEKHQQQEGETSSFLPF